MTKLFSLIYNAQVHLAPGKRVLTPEEYAALLSAEELHAKMQQELERKKREDEEATAKAKAEAMAKGFEEGLGKWAEQLAAFEKSLVAHQGDMEKNIIPIAIKAAQKVVGREMEQKPELFAAIVREQLKAVAQHHKFSIYVNPKDLSLFDVEKPRLKQVVDQAESFIIAARDDIADNTCTIETEAGIINVNLEELWKALEAAFQQLVSS